MLTSHVRNMNHYWYIKNVTLSFIVLFCFVQSCGCFSEIKIGALFHGQESQQEQTFRLAVEHINSKQHVYELKPYVQYVEEHDVLQVDAAVCELLSNGVWAIFGPNSSSASEQVQSICDTIEIPHIEMRWNTKQRRQDVALNLYPHPKALSKVYADLVKAWKWKSFTILFESDEGLIRLSYVLKMYGPKDFTVTVRHLNDSSNYRHVLRRVKRSGEINFILDCSIETLPEIMKQAQQVGLMTDEYNFIITTMDVHTIDLEPYQHGGTNITGFQLVDTTSDHVQNIINSWKNFEIEDLDRPDIEPEQIEVESALMYDAVHLFDATVRDMRDLHIEDSPSGCDNVWGHGHSFINLMRDRYKTLRGLTGPVHFDYEGFRTDFMLHIVELTVDGLQKIGTWNSTTGLTLIREEVSTEVRQEESLQNRTLIVLTAISKPYGMRVDTSLTLKGNDMYEGFGIDLIHEISLMLGFNYTFVLQLDSKYGTLNKETKKWDGMVRELLDGNADLAITDLTITAERESAVDFTMPFMNLGIAILYKKPMKAAPKLFSFMDPFSKDVWIVMFAAYIGVSLMLFVMGRISPYEWTNPYPCIEEPETLENQFTLSNSLWFTIGSLMQQGTEIAPIAVSTRMVAGIWWFFTLIMVSSYTANLAAFLTVESMYQPIKNVKDLADQNTIKYGAKRGGSTLNFFRDSEDEIYRRMYNTMINTPGVLTKDNDEGVEKVKNSNYAFFMESTSIEYVIERNCDLTQVGDKLDNKGYGIAMRKNMTYRNSLSTAVLKLQETGRLQALKNKWWKEERGGGQCVDAEENADVSGLKLENVGGVFVVLMVGVVFAIFVTFFELLWDVGHKSLKEKISFKMLLMEELRFVAKLHGTTKPVRKYNQDAEGEDTNNFIPLSPYTNSYDFVDSKEPLT
ncbi:glutamate receptor ionotropic, kainate 2-like isoform X1 [Schistocerca americana]|uniref:glutamate receptor ionotropic, kainate 2-like isoform X1 n=1 Tax=Schistocerca americana TaxID=7009 RepID=UPI001F4F14E5|nr:glutamate receptor ionotropic, kainate 2-like isoform X1 [Schistocerca americana]